MPSTPIDGYLRFFNIMMLLEVASDWCLGDATITRWQNLLLTHQRRYSKPTLLILISFLQTAHGWIVRMVYQRAAQYLWLKGNIYFFNRRVPKDMQGYYESCRINICFKATRQDTAARSAESIAHRLDDYWLSLRLANIDAPVLHLLRDRTLKAS